MQNVIMPTYARLPVTFARGEGVWLWDENGNKYLDALAGIAVCGLGHSHPAVTEAISAQAATLLHTSNLYAIDKQMLLAQRLVELAGMSNVFFGNSGAEANEAAFKIARRYGHAKGIDAPEVIVAEGSFHGRTLATLSATGNRKVQAGFEPLVQGFVRVPFGDLEAIETVAHNRPSVVAVLVEPIQGEGGINVPDDGYLPGLRRLCDENGWLLMLDEIQTGSGRTGHWFAWQHQRVMPDVMTLAKGLANGVPISACLAHGEAAGVLTAGTHGSTFGGNPLACSAGLAVIDVIEKEALVARAGVLGARIRNSFTQAFSGTAGVREIRGRGLMIGIELNRACGELVGRAMDAGLLINVTAGNVIRLLPPLVMSEDEADMLVEKLTDVVSIFCAEEEQSA